MERQKLIERMDIALQKMIDKGYQYHHSYYSLQAKRDAIANGVNYKLIDVTEEVIGKCGELFSRISRNYKLIKFDC